MFHCEFLAAHTAEIVNKCNSPCAAQVSYVADEREILLNRILEQYDIAAMHCEATSHYAYEVKEEGHHLIIILCSAESEIDGPHLLQRLFIISFSLIASLIHSTVIPGNITEPLFHLTICS